MLNVVAELVGHDVFLGERRVRAAEPAQLLEEGDVQIERRIGGAVKRPGLGAGKTAPGLHRIPENFHPRQLIVDAGLLG